MAFLDWFLPSIIVVGLILAIIAKSTGETLGEILSDIKEAFTDKTEDARDTTIGFYER